MGKSNPTRNARMIDTTTKQTGGVGMSGEREKGAKKLQTFREPHRKHNAINLPKNLIDSDSEEYEEESSSDDDNDQYILNGNGKKVGGDEITCKFENLTLNDKQNVMDKLLHKLSSLTKQYQDGNKHKGLKARSPYRNRFSEHKQKPFERHDLTVTTPHGNGGRVFVNSLTPSVVPEPVINFPKDNMLLDAIQDREFIASFIELSSDEAEQIFLKFVEQENQAQNPPGRNGMSPQTHRIVPKDVVIPQPMMSPQTSLTPDNSPINMDFYDSSYETGSPGSTVVTSPGSPGLPRSSVSSESDQELDSSMEPLRRIPPAPTNIVIIPAAPIVPKSEPTMRPLGEVVNYITTSANQRLYELSQSTSFCVKHFAIQLVRVVMTTKAENSADRIEGFSKSLINTMKTRILNKPHEGDIWQLSIFAHIQFLTAPDRVLEYRTALKSIDDHGRPLLYIAAIERYEKPLIARYIAESLSEVGFNPFEPMDDAGNTILHLVAEQGDSHIHVLSELLMAVGRNNKPLFNVLMTNEAGQTPLHVAAKSSRPQLTTLLLLLKMGARPFDPDHCQMTALHYHIQQMSGGLRRWEELEVVRKMLQAPMSLNKESLLILESLRSDPSFPADISNVILEEINRNCSKDLRPRKIERR